MESFNSSSGLWMAWGEAAPAGGVGHPGSVPSRRVTRHRRRGIGVSGDGVHGDGEGGERLE
ncbi:hypothetical protein E2562_009600 [Oryza meyeriana var. granulata]|uniref:Uncharacterized protein n=1 Tax=Oryza meyeriana var. granulata TaxID=110450 RepID=A0A6G1F636_9ORYZ|nr:hypothetical protein E2562_009600 [Oryza meyeriana var. granulata]